ncbi:hypothetical protein [Acidovorax sp. NCPPB 3576]|uniref:hypothetical protein n=1 Tax=Acidovorax sp. NCPPB 3576 TaxID=2940488 RepID=UPI00234A6307|nr:hypothetical protein [Acidovorax sp. NCPPB 3576]WCM89876.1 hypothetical protein M5C98_07575 [Acidovorax sp. NCPPB 3576]
MAANSVPLFWSSKPPDVSKSAKKVDAHASKNAIAVRTQNGAVIGLQRTTLICHIQIQDSKEVQLWHMNGGLWPDSCLPWPLLPALPGRLAER